MGLDQPLAILTDGTGSTDVSGLGEVVQLSPAGAILKEIFADRVSIELDGVIVSLSLKRDFKVNPSAAIRRETKRDAIDDIRRESGRRLSS